jgi:hypothetical protein
MIGRRLDQYRIDSDAKSHEACDPNPRLQRTRMRTPLSRKPLGLGL